jgi:hypothetical protein
VEKPGYFSRQSTKENKENKRLKSNNIIHCVLAAFCIHTYLLYIMTNRNLNLPTILISYHQILFEIFYSYAKLIAFLSCAHLPRNPDLVAFLLCIDPDLVAFFPRNHYWVAFPLCFCPDLVEFLTHAHLSKNPYLS